MNTSTPSSHDTPATDPTPLTSEQIEAIETNNKLLKQFTHYIEKVQQHNPAVELPITFMYTSFMAGVSTALSGMAYTANAMISDLNDMSALLLTAEHYIATDSHTSEESSDAPI